MLGKMRLDKIGLRGAGSNRIRGNVGLVQGKLGSITLAWDMKHLVRLVYATKRSD